MGKGLEADASRMPHRSGSPLGLCLLAGCGKWHLFPFPLRSRARTPPVGDEKGRALQPRQTLVHPHPRDKVQVWCASLCLHHPPRCRHQVPLCPFPLCAPPEAPIPLQSWGSLEPPAVPGSAKPRTAGRAPEALSQMPWSTVVPELFMQGRSSHTWGRPGC